MRTERATMRTCRGRPATKIKTCRAQSRPASKTVRREVPRLGLKPSARTKPAYVATLLLTFFEDGSVGTHWAADDDAAELKAKIALCKYARRVLQMPEARL